MPSRRPNPLECDALDDCGPECRAQAADLRRKPDLVERLVKLGRFEVDLQTGALSWSDGTYAIFGLPSGSPVTVEQALGFYDRDARDTIERALAAAERGEPYNLTLPFRSASGHAGWVRMAAELEEVGGCARLVGVIHDITHERDAVERLDFLAHQDTLTGLPNRRAFERRLDEALAGIGETGSIALCIVDVDRFKLINDAHGHAIGDELLREMARRLAASVRPTDLVARLGGDEFAILLQGIADEDTLRQQTALIVEGAHKPLACAGVTLRPSVSVGVCLAMAPLANVDIVLKQADVALYKAKLDGRDRFCVFEPSFSQKREDHDRLLDEVCEALSQGQFEVHYQPIVDLRTWIVRGWEALARWRHPTRGLLLPGSFLPALTDSRTSVAIDEFVLATSLGQMRRWLDAGLPVTCAGVNVSEAQLRRSDLVALITSLLEKSRLTPDRLKIEVLETALVGQNTEMVAATIDQLARIGVVSALDDFGTGYASLTHLKQFAVERIKIDRSFVANLNVSGYDQAIVRCMIALGRDLGIRITAEGIETAEQLRILRDLGCDCGQGYLFGRPMPPDDVPSFLEHWNCQEVPRLFSGNAEPLVPKPSVEALASSARERLPPPGPPQSAKNKRVARFAPAGLPSASC